MGSWLIWVQSVGRNPLLNASSSFPKFSYRKMFVLAFRCSQTMTNRDTLMGHHSHGLHPKPHDNDYGIHKTSGYRADEHDSPDRVVLGA